MKQYWLFFYLCGLLLTACQPEESLETPQLPAAGGSDRVSLRFEFAFPPLHRAGDNRQEEGRVNHLLYAIFQQGTCRTVEEVDLTSASLQAGGTYTVASIPKAWLDATTEIFAVANAPEALRKHLHPQHPTTEPRLHEQWRGQEWEADLNWEAAENASKGIDLPVMAGRHALGNDFPTTIVVPVERIYNRIWFQFEWDGQPETESITVDEITVSGLLTKTRLFNLNKPLEGNNPSSFQLASVTLRNPDSDRTAGESPTTTPSTLQPFFADLKTPPYHWGDHPQMVLHTRYPNHHTLAVYPHTADGPPNPSSPHRCYVYSFQRDGRSMKDNPEITVKYHFDTPVLRADGTPVRLHKQATARLYDDVHQPGKRHHGLLRNYTYQLNCKVTTLSQRLEIQVVSVPWYTLEIDDIPPFE